MGKCIRITQGFEFWPFPGQEFDLPAKRRRYNKNIRKQNRRIKTKSPDQLQRHFRSQLWIKTKIEKSSGLFATAAC